MKNKLLTLVLMLTSLYSFSQVLHHNVSVKLNITNGELNAIDTLIIMKDNLDNKDYIQFRLNSNLTVKSLDNSFLIEEVNNTDEKTSVPVNSYKISIEGKSNKLIIPLQYKGIINDQITEGAAEYARGFSETSGIIFEDGVFMAGSTYWLPKFENIDLFSFNLTVNLPEQWNVVSQGERTINEVQGENRIVKYESPELMDEIYLVANQWTEYSLQAGDVLVQAFLRTPDEDLANRYLHTTSKYLKIYENLIGPYPFTKFALVENFWETGYGMPSFTLLGEKVIRFPWILNSSYPHELLHNYWGNSVFVDYEEGNWCEGITVYMADHMIKEQSGQAVDYRRTTLQKFTDYVNPENDFPVVEFLSRSNSAEEAVGYGKSMMFNNMLRYEFGAEVFLQSYAKFNTDNKFRKASFDDIKASFEAVTGKDLTSFFDQWLKRTGAPTLKLSDVNIKEEKKQYTLSFNIAQTQNEDVFDVNIPVVVYLEGETTVTHEKINLSKRKQEYSFNYSSKPLRIDIDPQFDIIRRLDKKEVPATLSQVFGAKNSIIILPANSKHLDAYTGLANMWQKTQAAQNKTLEIIKDSDIESLPNDKALWVIGFDNKFADQVNIFNEYDKSFNTEIKSQIELLKKENAFVYAITNPENSENTIGFIGVNNDKTITRLSRTLLHYGKYGFLGFEGENAKNVLKGSLPALNSPMNYVIPYDGKLPEISIKIEPRKALTESVK
ncbi:MAG: hypothetical protein K8R31_01050 [Bacteroidales bacterium]|nr:hypothetical protein [Bacteroidales bacterium]